MTAAKISTTDTSEIPDLATFGQRLIALLGDWVLCLFLANGLISLGVLGGPDYVWPSVVLVVEYTAFLAFLTQTPGMRLARIHCVNTADGRALGPVKALIRAVLLALVVPILTAFSDPHRRGLHDKLTGSAMIRPAK
jgi:hypothetical protein